MLTLYIMKNAQRDRERLENLWRSLSLQDREWLRRRLLPADDEQTGAARPALSVTECRAAERWFEERCAGARTVRDRQARLRLWLLFLLLRYGGLRLVEALSLRPEDWDWQRNCLHVRGRPDRLVPLPLPLGRALHDRLEDPAFLAALASLPCDSSLIRRTLAQCGRACGFPAGLLSARSLRHNRARELRRHGLSPALVDAFLGRGRHEDAAPAAGMTALLRQRIQGEDSAPRSSARNTFSGRVLRCAPCGLACRVELITPGGLLLTAIITETSRLQLDIREGCRLAAQIKAPQVHLAGDGCTPPPDATHFRGEVEQLRSDQRWREIVLRLADGGRVCILQEDDHRPSLAPGMEAHAWFSALSVILSAD